MTVAAPVPRVLRAGSASRICLATGVAIAVAVGAATAAARIGGNADHSPVDPRGHDLQLLWTAGVLVALALYAAAVSQLRRVAPSTRVVLAIGAVVQLVPLAAPLLLSHDVFAYWEYGRLAAVHHVNPYATPPSAFPHDPAYPLMGSVWHHATTIYGPLFTLLAEAQAYLVGGSATAAELVYRVVAAVSILVAAALAARTARRAALGAALVAWNPLLALHFAGGGHNDALMIALLVAGLALSARGRDGLGGVAWAAAVGVKWVPIVFVPLLLLATRSRRFLAGLVGGLVALCAISTAAFGTAWIRTGGGLFHQARRQGALGPAGWLGDLGVPHRAVLVLLFLGFAAVFVLAALDALRRRRANLGATASAAALAQASLNPWYASWGIALGATEDDPAAHLLAVALTVYLALDALPL